MSSKPEVDNSWHERGELPPVGCECNYVTSFTRYKAKVCGHGIVGGCNVAFFSMYDSWQVATHEFFHPLRTEREKAIDEMANLIAKSVFGSAKCQAEKLYDAGYRKIASK